MILYGLQRYRLFEINPEMLAANTLAVMDEAMIVTRKDFRIEIVNLKAEKMLQVDQKLAAGTLFSEYFDVSAWERVIASDDSKQQLEVELIGRHGQRTPVRASLTAMRETDELEVFIFVLADITELAASYHNLQSKNKQINTQNQTLTENKVELAALLDEARSLQRQLAREKAGVEQTVAIRTKELVAAQKELQAADRLKTEFIMLTSHNLRTPLTIFLGGLELIKTTELTGKQTEILTMIDSSSDRLKQFIDDMLTISQLEAGEQSIQRPAIFASILEPLLAESQALADTKKLHFTADIETSDAAVQCSSLRLQGALRNVLNNAFKFTKSGSVQLSANVESNHIIIKVTDTGIGIKPQELPKLFSKFHRGTDAMQYDYEGEGIGLYLTKLIIADHHGKIRVDSNLGKGTTVTITPPIES